MNIKDLEKVNELVKEKENLTKIYTNLSEVGVSHFRMNYGDEKYMMDYFTEDERKKINELFVNIYREKCLNISNNIISLGVEGVATV